MAFINSVKQKSQRLSTLRTEAIRMALSLEKLLFSFTNYKNIEELNRGLLYSRLKG